LADVLEQAFRDEEGSARHRSLAEALAAAG